MSTYKELGRVSGTSWTAVLSSRWNTYLIPGFIPSILLNQWLRNCVLYLTILGFRNTAVRKTEGIGAGERIKKLVFFYWCFVAMLNGYVNAKQVNTEVPFGAEYLPDGKRWGLASGRRSTPRFRYTVGWSENPCTGNSSPGTQAGGPGGRKDPERSPSLCGGRRKRKAQ